MRFVAGYFPLVCCKKRICAQVLFVGLLLAQILRVSRVTGPNKKFEFVRRNRVQPEIEIRLRN